MCIKLFMVNNMKKNPILKTATLVVFIMLTCVFTSNAKLTLSGISVGSEYLISGRLNIANASVPTKFKFNVSVARSFTANGIWEDGTCIATLFHSSGLAISEPISIANANYDGGGIGRVRDINATLPANISSGSVYIQLKYYDNVIKQERIEDYVQSVVNIQYNPIKGIAISNVKKVETILFGTDCGFAHAYGTPIKAEGHMENGVWKFAYQVDFSIVDSTIPESDIYWEWIVEDNSQYIPQEKQFLVYPYGTTKSTPLSAQNGNRLVTVEANDYSDEYDSKVTVRAKSKRIIGQVYSADYVFYFSGVNH